MTNDKYEAVIGLEVHAHMLTRSKLFCGCATDFGAPPNHNVCPICMGMPGVLPVLNRHVVEVHAHMLTRSKLFCGCATDFGAPPNHNVCPICMGMPGVLPVLNRHVV